LLQGETGDGGGSRGRVDVEFRSQAIGEPGLFHG
jgi:hypothetical protein